MADSVQLTDLDVIARYSIAVRSATADRDELLETLRADVAWLERGRTRSSTSAGRSPADGDEAAQEEADLEEPESSSRPKRATSAKRATARRSSRT
ncbi:MAG TPA: hypothetical protein VHA79_15255 [Mycobacteriales bacterium]|jgi:hypothetical protein|nr:hypothetical protein [Mycobacteriales bacterium]